MNDATVTLAAVERGEPQAAEQLLGLLYKELRRLAASKMVHEKPGQTLQPTALVHEAWLRLVASRERERPESDPPVAHAPGPPVFANRRHFFAAAAEAMRRIPVEKARRRQVAKHGGGLQR